MRVFTIVVVFLLIGAFFIVSNKNLHLGQRSDFVSFSGMYYSWFGSLFYNAWGLTGYVVSYKWLPQMNSTNSSLNVSK